jgi:hypothetical protein
MPFSWPWLRPDRGSGATLLGKPNRRFCGFWAVLATAQCASAGPLAQHPARVAPSTSSMARHWLGAPQNSMVGRVIRTLQDTSAHRQRF